MQGWEFPSLWSVDVVAPGVVDPGSVFGFLAAHRSEVFPREEFDDMFADPVRGGMPSIPATVMLSAMVLQSLTGLSDRDAAHRLGVDLEWKAACGVAVDRGGFHSSTFVYWRKRIAGSGDPDRMLTAVNRVVAGCGVLKGKYRRVVDSTVVDDSVARQDTIRLVVWQIAKIAETVPELANWVMGLPGGVWYRGRLVPEIDWTSTQAKDEVVSVLVEDAARVVDQVMDVAAGLGEATSQRVRLEDEAGLLAVLAGQDVEPAPGSDGTDGRWRIARRTARDRVISTVDTEARHVRKTGQNKHDGFKAHVMAEPDTGLVVATRVSSGCGDASSDTVNAVKMLDTDVDVTAGSVQEVLGDSAYDSTVFLAAADRLGVEPVVKPRPLPTAVSGGYSLDDFTVDQDVNTVTCPAGHTVTRTVKGRASFTVWCDGCPLRTRCTRAKKGRVVTISTPQLRLRQHRGVARDPGFIQRLRTHRPMVERTLGWMLRPGRQTPYRGIIKTDAWWRARAAATNLKRLINLGLTTIPGGGWVTPPTLVCKQHPDPHPRITTTYPPIVETKAAPHATHMRGTSSAGS